MMGGVSHSLLACAGKFLNNKNHQKWKAKTKVQHAKEEETTKPSKNKQKIRVGTFELRFLYLHC